MERDPRGKVEVENDAVPVTSSVPVPMLVAPSLNVTVPEGVPTVLGPLTVAVKVTLWPCAEGLGEDASVVVLDAVLTVCDTAVEVLTANLASPEYLAVIECEPMESVAVWNVAWPELRVPLPICVLPSKNSTVPVIVPAELLPTVAVNVTDCPKEDGLADETSDVVVTAPLILWLRAVELLGSNVPSPE
jgi:hypothetical protein